MENKEIPINIDPSSLSSYGDTETPEAKLHTKSEPYVGHVGIDHPTPEVAFHIKDPGPIQSILHIGKSTVRIESTDKVPNRWRRFWYWALLGWTWEKGYLRDVPRQS